MGDHPAARPIASRHVRPARPRCSRGLPPWASSTDDEDQAPSRLGDQRSGARLARRYRQPPPVAPNPRALHACPLDATCSAPRPGTRTLNLDGHRPRVHRSSSSWPGCCAPLRRCPSLTDRDARPWLWPKGCRGHDRVVLRYGTVALTGWRAAGLLLASMRHTYIDRRRDSCRPPVPHCRSAILRRTVPRMLPGSLTGGIPAVRSYVAPGWRVARRWWSAPAA
jgi:hypothetical protein